MHLYSAEQSLVQAGCFFFASLGRPWQAVLVVRLWKGAAATCLGGFPVSAKLHSSPRKRARVTMGSSSGDSYLLLLWRIRSHTPPKHQYDAAAISQMGINGAPALQAAWSLNSGDRRGI